MIIICESCKGFMQVLRPEDVSSGNGHRSGYHVACKMCMTEIRVADLPGGVVSVDRNNFLVTGSSFHTRILQTVDESELLLTTSVTV